MSKYNFSFSCGFADELWTKFSGPTGSGELVFRHRVSDYWLKQANGDDVRASWRFCVGKVRLEHFYKKPPLTQELVDAFNAYRSDEYESSWASMRAQPERYGPFDESQYLAGRPIAATGCYFDVEALVMRDMESSAVVS